jgi:hypothetical protein
MQKIYQDISLKKWFLSSQAAQDYVKLEKAKQKLNLKVGDILPQINNDGLWFWDFHFIPKSKVGYNNPAKTIIDFKIIDNRACVVVQGGDVDYKYGLDIDGLTSPLMFGNKNVTILDKNHGEDLLRNLYISCEGEECSYKDALAFRKAITTIQNFKMDKNRINYMMENIVDESTATSPQLIKKIKIGCTVGTLDQIDKILEACENYTK